MPPRFFHMTTFFTGENLRRLKQKSIQRPKVLKYQPKIKQWSDKREETITSWQKFLQVYTVAQMKKTAYKFT